LKIGDVSDTTAWLDLTETGWRREEMRRDVIPQPQYWALLTETPSTNERSVAQYGVVQGLVGSRDVVRRKGTPGGTLL